MYPARKYGQTGHRDWQAGPTVRQQETKWQARHIGSQEIRPDRSHQGTQSSRAPACMIYKQHKGIMNKAIRSGNQEMDIKETPSSRKQK